MKTDKNLWRAQKNSDNSNNLESDTCLICQ